VCNFDSRSADLELRNADYAVWQVDKPGTYSNDWNAGPERPWDSALVVIDSTSSLKLNDRTMEQLLRFRGSTVYTMNAPMILEIQTELMALAFSVSHIIFTKNNTAHSLRIHHY
jgi:hypothetical protein